MSREEWRKGIHPLTQLYANEVVIISLEICLKATTQKLEVSQPKLDAREAGTLWSVYEEHDPDKI